MSVQTPPDGEERAHPLTRAERWLLAVCALVTMAISHFDRQVLGAIAPWVTAELDITTRGYGLLASSFSVAYMIAAPIAGRIIDRMGTRRGIVVGVTVWSLVAASHGIAAGFSSLLILRIMLGLTESPSAPSAAQVIHRGMLPSERPAGFGLLFTGSSLGAALAPPIAVAIARDWDWRAAFAASALAGVAWVPLWWAITSRRSIKETLAPPGVADPARPRPGWRAVLDPHVGRAALAEVATAPLMVFLLQWGAKFLVAEHSVDKADVGNYLWAPPIGRDVGSIFFGFAAAAWARRSGKVESPRPLFAVAVVLCFAIVLQPLAETAEQAILIAVVSMMGAGGVTALMISEVMSRVAGNVVSLVGGVVTTVQQLGFIIGNIAIAEIVTRTQSYDNVTLALAAWLVPGCVLWLMWRPPHSTPPGAREAGP